MNKLQHTNQSTLYPSTPPISIILKLFDCYPSNHYILTIMVIILLGLISVDVSGEERDFPETTVRIRIEFDERCATEENYDWLKVSSLTN